MEIPIRHQFTSLPERVTKLEADVKACLELIVELSESTEKSFHEVLLVVGAMRGDSEAFKELLALDPEYAESVRNGLAALFPPQGADK